MVEPGRINVSANTYDPIKAIAHNEYRGEILVKNKGVIKMNYADKIEKATEIALVNK